MMTQVQITIDSFDNFASFFNRPLPHGKKQRLEKDLYC
jgi:hypothetical protein